MFCKTSRSYPMVPGVCKNTTIPVLYRSLGGSPAGLASGITGAHDETPERCQPPGWHPTEVGLGGLRLAVPVGRRQDDIAGALMGEGERTNAVMERMVPEPR